MNAFPAITIGILVVVTHVFFFCGLMIVIARLSGWIALAQRYRLNGRFDGTCWYFQHAQFRWSMNYSGALTIGVNGDGLYLSIWPMFRPGHPRLFIPWSETTIRMSRTFWLGNYMEIQFPNVPRTLIRFHERLAKRIAATVGPQLAHAQTTDTSHAATL